jgi:hypothetical protein
MATNKISPMEKKTAVALESTDPFGTRIPEPQRIDGRPVVAEREFVPQSSTPDLEPPTKDRSDSEDSTPEAIPDDVAEFLRDEEEPMLLNNIPVPESAPIDITEEQAQESYDNPIIETRTQDGLPSYRCEFSGRDIFVAWPWYKTTNPVTAATQVAYALDLGKDKIRFDMSIGDSIIGHSRNRLAHKFLETDAKWLLMIDDDIIPSIGRPNWFRYWVQGARNLQDSQLQRHGIHRLIGANKTLIGGAYFGRQENGALMCSDQKLFHRAKAYEEAIVPVEWVGTGFILIHRKVFKDIREKFGDSLKINVPDYDYDYFRQTDGASGEDVSFCRRAKSAGHQPHIDLGLPIFHVGAKTY